MSSASSSRAPRAVSLLALLAALAVVAPAAQAQAPVDEQHWHGNMYSTPAGSCDLSRHADPIGVVFHGTAANWGALASVVGNQYHAGDIEFHTRNWSRRIFTGDASYASYGVCKARQDADQGGPGDDRHHIRLWQQPRQHVSGSNQTVGTPHYDRHDEATCTKRHHYVPPTLQLDGGGTGSGFDYTRRRLLRVYQSARAHRHPARSVYWGNTSETSQCGGKWWVGSNGWVNIIRVGRE